MKDLRRLWGQLDPPRIATSLTTLLPRWSASREGGRTGHDASRRDSTTLDGGKAVGAALFVPATAPRRARKAAISAARTVKADHQSALRAQRRAELAAAAGEAKAASYLPAHGEAGSAALRSYRPLRVKPHRATSEVLAGAYPFLAEAGLGSEGVLVGNDSWSGAAFVFDPWVLYEHGVLTNPNVLLAGIIGRREIQPRQVARHPLCRLRAEGLRPWRPEGRVDGRGPSGWWRGY